MIKLLLAGIIGLIFIFALIIIIRNKPDFWFWIFLNLFFDPGGYILGYLGGNLFGPLNVTDIFIVGMVICLITVKINWKVIFVDQLLLRFLLALFIFSAYYFIVYGGVVPYFKNDFNYSTFLIKNRVYAYGFIILISVYVFSLRGLKYFYAITISIGVICLSLYLVALLTGFNLIYVWEIPRYGDGDTNMMRISMISYGLFDMIFPLALTAYLLSRKINLNLKYKPWLYFGGTMMIIILVITLTKRTQIEIIGTIIIIIIIMSYLLQMGKLSSMFKLVIPVLLVVIALYFTIPKYIGYIIKVGEDTFLLITTGKDSRGESDYRVSGTDDLDITKEYIKKNYLFGTGYTYLNWKGSMATSPRGATYARAADAAGEVSIYYLFFGFGIVGAILIFPLYFMMGILFFKLIKLLKLNLIIYLQDPITIIFSIYILLTISTKFTFDLFQLSSDFRGPQMSTTAVFMGLGLALYRKLYLNILTQPQ